MKYLWQWLSRCHHEWCINGTNGFGLIDEEICMTCGKYRHRLLKAENGWQDPQWIDGKHPKSK